MRFEIDFENDLVPAGYAAAAARRGDKTCFIQMRGFTSSEDGGLLISRLEGIPSAILNRISPRLQIPPAEVREMLAIVGPGPRATVYLNESRATIKLQTKREILTGEAVYKDDIADIQAVEFNSIEVPAECGVVFVFSLGWCKGFYFDLESVAGPSPQPRYYDLNAALGQCYSQLFFQELFSIGDAAWENLFSQGWFLFRGLSTGIVKGIISYAENGWPVDELMDDIVAELRSQLNKSLDRWVRSPVFVGHQDLLAQAVDRFQSDDFISCCSILYPRIEGLLRTFHRAKGEVSKPTQNNLSESAVDNPWANRHGRSILLPEKFQRYLREVYFASFDEGAGKVPASRHSVAHGVAPSAVFTLKSATVALLIVQQLSYYFAPAK